ncbi:MAG: sigma-70 family RNA polymerase sigma factor, partial [Anaerotignum sp.]|nr:sigma-70 family RNA polymerase sigma factor [Anaerotignum sp.]
LSCRAKKLQERIGKEENREPTIKELAEKLQVEREELIMALESAKEVESLYTVHRTAQEAEGTQLLDRLGDYSENEKMLERLWLKEALEQLSPKEKKIIIMRYFLDQTQTDVAKHLGISQVQVSRTEKKILCRMKNALQ